MMRFTFLQLCAAEVPVPIPQQETERNLDQILPVDLYDSSWNSRLGEVPLAPKGQSAANYQIVADQLNCNAHLVIVLDTHWQKADLSGTQPRYAACALRKDAPMKDVFRQLMLTGFVVDQLPHEDSTHVSKDIPQYLWDSPGNFFYRLNRRDAAYFFGRKNYNLEQGTEVSFCDSPHDPKCRHMARIIIKPNGDMSVAYLQNGSTKATMEMSPAGKFVLKEGDKVVGQLSPEVQQKFRSLPKYMRSVATPYLDVHEHLPTDRAQTKLRDLWTTLTSHARDL